MNKQQYIGQLVQRLAAGALAILKLERRQEPLWMRLGAIGLVLTAFCCITAGSARFAHNNAGASTVPVSPIVSPVGKEAAPQGTLVSEVPMEQKSPGPIESGKLLSTQDGMPHLAIAMQSDPNMQIQYALASQTQILLNGSPVVLPELKPGDSVKVTADKNGVATLVEATRSKTGIILRSDNDMVTLTTDYLDAMPIYLANGAAINLNGKPARMSQLKTGDAVSLVPDKFGKAMRLEVCRKSLFDEFWDNFCKNLFKPLLLFFYMGFLIPVLRIAFDFPRAVYQGLTIYLLISIGWHGGEELSVLSGAVLNQALGFIVVGFLTNLAIGLVAYLILTTFIPKLRKIDSATIAAYYGSDSAGTFVTCVGVLQAAHIAFAAYMPVMLAVMEIPGCLVGLYLVSRLRKAGMDKKGNMPGEPGYKGARAALVSQEAQALAGESNNAPQTAVANEGEFLPEANEVGANKETHPSGLQLIREVMLNPGLFLLFGGIIIGYISRLQGVKAVEADDKLFVTMFQGLLCLFLLEMGMTASRHLKDLTTASWRFIAFGLLAPNIFAITGMCIAMIFSHLIHMPFQLGTYVLFAVLCGAASYIAVPAIQRIAIKEASPTLPLAASLGLTFSYNVTIGIPVYLVVAQNLLTAFPVAGGTG